MQAKDLGSASAWLELGKMAVEGIVLYPDNNVAMRCFEKAIELGSVGALVELGKIYMENGDTQITEYGSGDVISGEEVISALSPLSGAGDIDSEDYLEVFKHCQVFKDKTLTNCEEKAKELFEKAVSLGEGRGYLQLAQLPLYADEAKDVGEESLGEVLKNINDRKKVAKECRQKAIELLKVQAQKGDIEAYALWGKALMDIAKNTDEGNIKITEDEIIQLYQKAIESGYADGYEFLGQLIDDKDERKACYAEGAKLGSGQCALSLFDCYAKPSDLKHAGHDDLENFRLMAEQAVEFVDSLLEPIKLLEFVALTCRHHKVWLCLVKLLSLASKVSDKAGLESVGRFKHVLNPPYKYFYKAFMRPNMEFAVELGEAWWAQQNDGWEFGLGRNRLRAFTNPAVRFNGFCFVDANGEFGMH